MLESGLFLLRGVAVPSIVSWTGGRHKCRRFAAKTTIIDEATLAGAVPDCLGQSPQDDAFTITEIRRFMYISQAGDYVVQQMFG
ncbi:hypothetical protein BH23CHL4_BH23CHL4_24000 [soil metagenome]